MPKTSAAVGRLVTLDEVAERLGVSLHTVRRLITNRELTPTDVGAGGRVSWRVSEVEVARFIARRTSAV